VSFHRDELRHGNHRGTVLVLYATFLGPVIPNALGHLLIA
jgi:hypothetical protein